jgi:DNA polymerase III epsilon subunit-like protein
MNRKDWVLIDTETTGLRTDDWVIEVCIQQMQGWRPVGTPKSWLINVPQAVGKAAFGVHGISDAMLAREGEDPSEAHDAILEFIDGRPFGAFNMPFDRRMLNADWDRLGIASKRRPPDALCALRLARLFVTDAPAYNLEAIAEHLNFKCQPKHRAKHDVKATVELLLKHIGPRIGEVPFSHLEDLCKLDIYHARRLVALSSSKGVYDDL